MRSTNPEKFILGSLKIRNPYPTRYLDPCSNLSKYAESSRSAGSRKNTNFVKFLSFMACVASSGVATLFKTGLSGRKCGSPFHLLRCRSVCWEAHWPTVVHTFLRIGHAVEQTKELRARDFGDRAVQQLVLEIHIGVVGGIIQLVLSILQTR